LWHNARVKTARAYFPLIPLGFIVTAAVAGFAVFFLPVTMHGVNTFAVHTRAVASTVPIFLLVGAAVVFMSSLRTFKAGLRSAYLMFAIGMLMFGILLAQISIWGLFNLWDTAWATSGAALVPLALTTTLIYFAARKFSRLLQIKNILNNVWVVTGLTIVIGTAMGIFAHYFIKYHISGSDIYVGVCGWGAVFATCATVLIYRVYHVIGASYQLAMRWLAVGLAVFSAACWHEAITTLWFNNGSRYTDYGFYLIPWSITGLVMLYAAYHFHKITVFESAAPVAVTASAAAAPASVTDRDYIDSVWAIAKLASRPDAIDPLLDDLRIVTVSMQPKQPLANGDLERLMFTFQRLESYLSNEDPLRTVSHEEVMSHVTPAFRAMLENAN
jgi:hypothetical protein